MPSGVEKGIYGSRKPLILASNSPRRKSFLAELGLQFEVKAAHVDESVRFAEAPRTYVERMAREKAQAIMALAPGSWVVGADTAVCLGDTIFGKPDDEGQAVEMLMTLSGKKHRVLGGICIGCASEQVLETRSVVTEVLFSSFSRQVALAYVAQGESMDKAGAYGIQGRGGFLVERIEGSYSNVVGLPLVELLALLEINGVIAIG